MEEGDEMGAIVKLNKMPEKCSDCIFANDEITFCRLRNRPIIAGKRRNIRMPLCPLINEGEYLTKQLRLLERVTKVRSTKASGKY